MKNTQKGFVIPLVIIVVLAAIGGVGYVWQKQKAVSMPEAEATSTAKTPEPVITVVSPNGGEVWKMSGQGTVTWTYDKLPSDAEIGFSLRSDKAVCHLYNVEMPADQKTIIFTLLNRVCEGRDSSLPADRYELTPGKYKVEIGVTNYGGGKGITDQSDAYFTIVE